MTKSEWRYLKTIEKGRKLEAYKTLPISKPFWQQTPVTVLLVYFVIIMFIKLAIKYNF